jgi:leucyl aminopeptidase
VEFSIKAGRPENLKTSCIVVAVQDGAVLSAAAAAVDKLTGGAIARLVSRGEVDGKAGSMQTLHEPAGLSADRVIVAGFGKKEQDKDFATAIRAVVKALAQQSGKDAHLYLPELARPSSWAIRSAVQAASEALYRFDQYKSGDTPPAPKLKRITLLPGLDEANLREADRALTEGKAIADGIATAKTLGNQPPNVCTPTFLADFVKGLAKDLDLECKVLDRAAMAKLGMNSLLAVAQGSAQEPRLIVAHYRGGKRKQKPVVLVGKGVTFDSGGISLKPGEGMDEMKFDMCGAASVIGALHACARMRLPINLSIVVPAVENMPGSKATRPGDIVASMSGQTVEILNTDAEGRLILCDALTYAERFEPDTVIDVATLTGACVIALGGVASGLFSPSDDLASALIAAGEESADRAWRMPVWDDYQEQLKSNFADMANIGGRPAGAVTAACFLARFTKYADWAHLDIAGTAWKSGAEKGATGRPVSLLAHYLMARAAAQ